MELTTAVQQEILKECAKRGIEFGSWFYDDYALYLEVGEHNASVQEWFDESEEHGLIKRKEHPLEKVVDNDGLTWGEGEV